MTDEDTEKSLYDASCSECRFYQEPDSCDKVEAKGQNLKIETNDAGAGPYLVLQTERWAINPEDVDDFAKLLKRIICFQTSLDSMADTKEKE